MEIKIKEDLIKIIIARFGDLHEHSFEELMNKSIYELNEITSRDSLDLYR